MSNQRTDVLAQALGRLEQADARVDAGSDERRSLAPGRSTATRLRDLGARLLADETDPSTILAFGEGLADLAEAQLEHFPGNLFWDLDYPAATTLRRPPAPGQSRAEYVAQVFGWMAELQALYGRHTPIRFSYVHDFSYGFDWAKWVRREPAQDGSVEAFDRGFLQYMRRRAGELRELIAADDRKYPTLRDAGPRNPFPFSREPEAEVRLHRELARRGLLPVEAWNVEARPKWDRAFYDLRVEVASELDLLVAS